MTDAIDDNKRPKTLWGYVRKGFVDAHQRRPISFYLLLLIPVVLLLGAHIGTYRQSPLRFAGLLSLMLVFFGVVVARAVNDLFALCRKHLREKRAVYQETIGDPEFAETLGARVRRNRPEK